MLQSRMGVLKHGPVDAAKAMSSSHSAISQLIGGTSKGVSVEMCLKLAYYLQVYPPNILRLADHEDIAAIWTELAGIHAPTALKESDVDIAIYYMTQEMTPEQRRVTYENVRNIASTFRTTTQTTGGDNAKEKRPPRPRRIRKPS